MGSQGDYLTLEDGLMLLNDHAGERVLVRVTAVADGAASALMATATGTLSHWRNDPGAMGLASDDPALLEAVAAAHDGAMSSLYVVGRSDDRMTNPLTDPKHGTVFVLNLIDATGAQILRHSDHSERGLWFDFGDHAAARIDWLDSRGLTALGIERP
jgi:hypothetical protein